MKSFLVLSLLTLVIFNSVAHATQNFITCTRVQNSSGFRSFVLEITDQNVSHVKVRLYNYRLRNLVSTKLLNQNIPDYTAYAVQGISTTMEVENQILIGNSGIVRMGKFEFSCL